MLTKKDAVKKLDSVETKDVFLRIYGKDNAEMQKQRYIKAFDGFEEIFGVRDNLSAFSTPGRTEIGGNHTDHNHGRVLAGSVNLDVIAIVSENSDNVIRLKSEGFEMDTVELSDLAPAEKEKGSSQSLIRGVCARLSELGYKIGGFDAYTTSSVLKGSGLSSSAAFEVLVANIISHLFNNGTVSPVLAAQVSQYAENVYFGKPSGLMDQTACSVGGFVAIDFNDPKNPIIEKIDFDFENKHHALCIIDTAGNHADLTDEYAAIKYEMASVAKEFSKEVLREVPAEEFLAALPELRKKVSDRALLRAFHFFADNERVVEETNALKEDNFDEFLRLIKESGYSSFMYNQNLYSVKNPGEQGLSLALALTEKLLSGRGGFRVHGGGFAGTIQAFVPLDILGDYKKSVEAIFGEGSCYVLFIRPEGAIRIM